MYYGPQGASGCQRGAGVSVGPRFGLETAKTRNQGRFHGFIRALALLPTKSSPYPVKLGIRDYCIQGRDSWLLVDVGSRSAFALARPHAIVV